MADIIDLQKNICNINDAGKKSVKASAMYMDLNTMAKDLKQAQTLLSVSVESAKELHETMKRYVQQTNMEQYVDQVNALTDDQIANLTLEELNRMFPGHNLMAWGAIDVPEIPGSFEYTIEEYREYLTNFRDQIHSYDEMILSIDQAKEMITKMSNLLFNTKMNQARIVASSDSPQAEKAKKYLADLEDITVCGSFFRYVKENVSNIMKANKIYLVERGTQWLKKATGLDDIFKVLLQFCEKYHWCDGEYLFLFRSIHSYMVYADGVMSRDISIKRQNLYHLMQYFKEQCETEEIRANICEQINMILYLYEQEVKQNESEGNV